MSLSVITIKWSLQYAYIYNAYFDSRVTSHYVIDQSSSMKKILGGETKQNPWNST